MSEIVLIDKDYVLLPKLLKMLDRSWLKVFTFFGVWAVIWLPIALAISKASGQKLGKTLIPKQKLILLASLYFLSPIVLTWKIKVENISFESLGLSLQPIILVHILLGLFVGLGSLIIIFAIESAFNLVSWHWERKQQLVSLLLPILLLSLFISVVEESIFRGYVLNTLADDYSYGIAAIISSIVFALLHLIWERKETLPQIPGLWLMGMILVAAKAIDRSSLGLAIGLHASWIWGLTCIDSAQLLTYKNKDSWLTGLNQQPLAGIAGISCLVVTGLVLWLTANSSLLI